MMKRLMSQVMAAVVLSLALTACGGSKPAPATAAPETATAAPETTAAETTAAPETTAAEKADKGEAVRVGSLKGPTTMGLVNLMRSMESGEAEGNYEFTIATQADELLAKVVSGDLDIALVPANVASVLYNKTEGKISAVNVNTLGVLYCVSGDESVKSVKDLAGKTVLSTGQGTTPDYVLRILLDKNEVKDCNVEFKSEATEVAAALKADPNQIAILPQPFVTAAEAQNEALKTAFSLTDAWDEAFDDSQLVTGVTIVRNAFLDEHEDAVKTFLAEHAMSAWVAQNDLDKTAELVAKYGIIEKAPVARKALPYCNIVCITGDEMKTALSGYLEALAGQDPKAVGGKVPGDDFYYIAK